MYSKNIKKLKRRCVLSSMGKLKNIMLFGNHVIGVLPCKRTKILNTFQSMRAFFHLKNSSLSSGEVNSYSG